MQTQTFARHVRHDIINKNSKNSILTPPPSTMPLSNKMHKYLVACAQLLSREYHLFEFVIESVTPLWPLMSVCWSVRGYLRICRSFKTHELVGFLVIMFLFGLMLKRNSHKAWDLKLKGSCWIKVKTWIEKK